MVSKTLILFLILILSFCANTGNGSSNDSINQNHSTMDKSNLLLNFVLIYDETSKDSNSETIKISISDKKIQITKNYNGFKAPENKQFEKDMDEEMKKNITEFIEKHQLNTDIKELKETKGIGIEGYLRVEIFQPKTTTIIIEGKTNIWGSDDYVKKNWGKQFVESRTNIENIKYFSKAKSFVQFIEGL